MEEKIMNLLEQILEKQTSTNDQLEELAPRVKQIDIKVETDLGYKIKALFDAREVQNNINNTILNAVERIETKLEILQIETAHIRKVK